MPLTHKPPPQPVRAIHVEEVQRAAETIAAATIVYLRRLMAVLEYRRTEWARGTGVSARAGAVSATSPGRSAVTPTQAPYVTGSDTPRTSAVANKPVLLATTVGGEQPTRSRHRFYDGVLVSAIPDGAPLPAPVPRPVEPAPIDMTDLDEDTYQDYITGWGKYLAAFIEYLVDQEWRQNWAFVTRFPTGTVLSVSMAQKTAKVRLEPQGANAGTVEQLCGFGNRQWTAGMLLGKFVRVAHDPTLGYLVDDWET